MNFCSYLVDLLIQDGGRGRRIEELVYIFFFSFQSVTDTNIFRMEGLISLMQTLRSVVCFLSSATAGMISTEDMVSNVYLVVPGK